MTTLLSILGGLAVVGWTADQIKGSPDWQEFTARWNQPVPPQATTKPAPAAKPRIVNPLEQTFDVEELTAV